MWPTIATAISLLIGFGGFYLGWVKFRQDNLRKSDVLNWADESIEALQHIVLIVRLPDLLTAENRRDRLEQLVFQTSTLVERGRIFFKNEVVDSWGAEKPLAYRGYRPKLLDRLVLAHQIASRLHNQFETRDSLIGVLAERNAREFVSLVQQEIGRDRTACIAAKKGGTHIDLVEELDRLKRNYANNPENSQ